jgi:single-strand DNA-binding protein
MSGYQQVMVIGRLGQDPVMKYTPSGLAICEFSVATSKKQKDGSEKVSWHRLKAFGKTAELIGQYVSKGREIHVIGELSYGQYEKDNIKHYTTDIIINSFTFIGNKSVGEGSQPQQERYQPPVNQSALVDDPLGEIPF